MGNKISELGNRIYNECAKAISGFKGELYSCGRQLYHSLANNIAKSDFSRSLAKTTLFQKIAEHGEIGVITESEAYRLISTRDNARNIAEEAIKKAEATEKDRIRALQQKDVQLLSLNDRYATLEGDCKKLEEKLQSAEADHRFQLKLREDKVRELNASLSERDGRIEGLDKVLYLTRKSVRTKYRDGVMEMALGLLSTSTFPSFIIEFKDDDFQKYASNTSSEVFTYMNPAMAHLLGHSPATILSLKNALYPTMLKNRICDFKEGKWTLKPELIQGEHLSAELGIKRNNKRGIEEECRVEAFYARENKFGRESEELIGIIVSYQPKPLLASLFSNILGSFARKKKHYRLDVQEKLEQEKEENPTPAPENA